MSWFKNNVDEQVGSALIRLMVVLPNKTKVERDFRPDLEIDYDLLEIQLSEIPEIFAFWSVVLAEQKANTEMIEREIKLRKSMITRELLDESKRLAADGAGIGTRPGLRQSDIKDLMQGDDTLLKLDAMYIKSNKMTSKLYGIVEALRMKSEGLRSLAGFKKQELQNTGN